MLLTLDAGLFHSNTFEKTNNRSTWWRGNDAMFSFVCVDVSRCDQEQQLLEPSESLALSFVLRAGLMVLARPSLGSTQLVWQQLISAPGRICSSRLINPSHGTIPIALKWTHTCTSKKICHFCPKLWQKKKRKKILLHHQKGKTRVFIPLVRFLFPGSKNRKKGQNSD